MEAFSGKRLIIVSNREPYCLKKEKYEKTVGGLVSALDPVMQASRGVWIASGTEAEARKGLIRAEVPPGNPSYTMRKVPLSLKDIEGYYNGYSNRFLWPLCHITLDRVNLLRSYWQSYTKVNRLFARAVIEEAGEKEAVVWLHDYHLALCAGAIKTGRPDIKVALFWHIPWPPHAVYRICPHRKEILKGLLANDLLGFQLEKFKTYFMRCVEFELEAKVDFRNGLIDYMGHSTALKAFPISMDFDWFDRAASTEEAGSYMERFVRERNLKGLMLGLGVSRLDYTKGMIKCLNALDTFFGKYPRYRGRFTFIQVCVPTRKAEPYASYRDAVNGRIDEINGKYSSKGWRPIERVDGELTHAELAALYRNSDVALVTSVYDGMNLVAKEYIASQVEMKGALLVSEFAGASDIPGVTVINPYDPEGCADALKKALEAKPSKKRKALESARRFVRKHNIYKWVGDILKEIRKIR